MTLDNPAAPMSLNMIATRGCGSNTCPTVFHRTDRGTLIIQGYPVSAAQAGVDVPEGEALVEIPADLLAEAARLLD